MGLCEVFQQCRNRKARSRRPVASSLAFTAVNSTDLKSNSAYRFISTTANYVIIRNQNISL